MQASFSYGATNFSPKRFEKLLNYLTEKKYTFVSLHETEKKLNEKSVLITFDDGYAHLFEQLPALMQKYNFKPLIFIPTFYIGNSNSWDYSHAFQKSPHLNEEQIRELSSEGVDFGSHTHTHRDLKNLSTEELTSELRISKMILEDITKKEINTISYPFGQVDERVISFAESIGYQYGYTMKFPVQKDRNLSIGRYPIYGFDTMLNVKQKINQGIFYHCERIKSIMISKSSTGTDLINKFKNIK